MGSQMCTVCHQETGWQQSSHSQSIATWNGRRPDPWPDSDYTTVSDNGCENCHGPGSKHVAAENGELDELTDELIAKYRSQMRLEMGKAAHEKCLECHDLDNSPDFHKPGQFEAYWKEVAHPWSD